MLLSALHIFPCRAQVLDATKTNMHLMATKLYDRSALAGGEACLATAKQVSVRVKLTKFETLCCRAFRDSRRKREHIER